MNDLTMTSGESFFINVYRSFEFLRLKGYEGKDFNLSGRETKYISFYSHLKSQRILIIEQIDGSLDLIIDKKTIFKKPISFYRLTKIKYTGVKYFSQAVQANPKMMAYL